MKTADVRIHVKQTVRDPCNSRINGAIQEQVTNDGFCSDRN